VVAIYSNKLASSVCVSKVRDQGKKEEVPIQLVFTEKQ